MPTIVTLVGNLVSDPEERSVGSDKNLTKIRVACTDRVYDGSGGWKDGDTAFYTVSAWRNLGKYVLSSLKKGDKVIVQGKMKYSEFKRADGTNGHSYEVEATDVGIALYAKTAKNVETSSVKESDIVKGPNPWS